MRGESGIDIDQKVELFCCVLLQRLDFPPAADVVDKDGEIQGLEACHEVFNLLARSQGGVEYGGFELHRFVFSFELDFCSLELFRVPAVQDDIEAVGGKFLRDAKADAIASSCYQSPGTVAVQVALYG